MAFLPTVLTQALTSDTVKVGSLDPVRDMNYVSDTARGFLLAASAEGIDGETINLGSGRGVTMGELLEAAVAAAGREVRVETDPARVRPEKSEVLTLVADATRARERLGWTPEVTLEEGVARTATWIREHLDDYKPDVYTV